MVKNLSVTIKKPFFRNGDIEFPESKSLTVFLGLTGSGKTTLLLECVAQWLKKDIPVAFVTSIGAYELVEKEVPNLSFCTDVKFLKSLKDKYSDLFNIYSYENLSSFDVSEKVLVLDEFHLGVNTSLITELANSAPHIFVSTQIYSEISVWINDLYVTNHVNLHFIIMESDIADLRSLPKVNHQQNDLENLVQVADWEAKRKSFRSFISLTQLQDQSRVHVHKFLLKGHSAF
jgi:hypothetical protein